MRNIKIIGYGGYVPDNKVIFEGGTRPRCKDGETQLDMAVKACNEALEKAHINIKDIDCIVSTSAVGVQPIPCTAALIHERIARGLDIPAFDINSTCTSFVTALDIMSYLIQDGRYNRVLIVASDIASKGLNEDEKESYELFSDAACAFIIEKSYDKEQGVIASMQKTWSEGAHKTEIRGGLSNLHASCYKEENKGDYLFSMQGLSIVSILAKRLPKMFNEFMEKYDLKMEDIDVVIPHQASKALPLIMKRLGIKNYVDMVKEYGNQVSVSIPYMLYLLMKSQKVKEKDKVLLLGTAAGLTTNILLIRI